MVWTIVSLSLRYLQPFRKAQNQSTTGVCIKNHKLILNILENSNQPTTNLIKCIFKNVIKIMKFIKQNTKDNVLPSLTSPYLAKQKQRSIRHRSSSQSRTETRSFNRLIFQELKDFIREMSSKDIFTSKFITFFNQNAVSCNIFSLFFFSFFFSNKEQFIISN